MSATRKTINEDAKKETARCHQPGQSEQIKFNRRRFLSATVMSVAAAQLGIIGSADLQAKEAEAAATTAPKSEANGAFGPVKQIDAGLLNVGYVEAGPADGRAVILLHGWPYDIQSFADVTPLLAAKGYRVIVPICAGTAQRVFFRTRLFEMASRRQLPPTS
jgi:hypothetical protein